MIKPLHTGRLVLTPEDPYLLPADPVTLITGLREIGLIGEALEPGPGYLLGERFMQLVSFMGCSPHIRLEPDDPDEPFCHLLLDGPYPRPRLLTGRNTQPPRCCACRKRLNDWRESFETWQRREDPWLAVCPHCGQWQDPASYDFRQSAGCGSLFLLLENIFPQEAIPSPNLLEWLSNISKKKPWRYFYLQD